MDELDLDWWAEVLRNRERRGESSSPSGSFVSHQSGSSSDYSPRSVQMDSEGNIEPRSSPRFNYHEWEDEWDRDTRHLLEAAEYGYLHRVKRLLGNHSVSIESTNFDGETALMKAAASSHVDTVQFLLKHKADVNATSRDGRTALMMAAEKGAVATVELLLARRSIVVDATTQAGMTALMLAARHGRVHVLRCLVDAGADMNAKSASDEPAVLFAAKNGHLEAVQFLVGVGADLDTSRLQAGRHFAEASALNEPRFQARSTDADMVTARRVRVVRCLIEIGVDVDTAGEHGQTALMRAVDANHFGMARVLLEHGADVSARDNNGQTAMSIAMQRGRRQIQQLLVQYMRLEDSALSAFGSQTRSLSKEDRLSWAISATDVELRSDVASREVGIGEFLAKWLDVDVVIKLFVPDASSSTLRDAVTRWHQLRHPNVIKLLGACDAGHHFFVCEYASNGSIVEFLAASKPDDRTSWKFLHEAALGLLYLHERQIFHGNLRGSNILIGSDGHAKLADFGVSGSFRIGESPDPNGFIGAVRWQSPERLRGSPPSSTSDVYSFGMCVLQVVSGSVPWRYETREDTVVKFVTGSGVQMLGRPRGFADDEWRLVKQMCASSPEERLLMPMVAATLEFFAAREMAARTRPQPEPELPAAVDGRGRGESLVDEHMLSELVGATKTGLERCILDDFQALHGKLQQAKRPGIVLQRFNVLFFGFRRDLRESCKQTRVDNLMAVRVVIAEAHRYHQKAGVLWEAARIQASVRRDREDKWRLVRAQHLADHIVDLLEVCQAPPLQQTLFKSMEICSSFVGFLRAEIDSHADDYTTDQLSIMTQACRSISSQALQEDDSVDLAVLFIPRSELQRGMNSVELGAGAFGRVHTARWLGSKVVVKELTIGGDSNATSASRWAMSSCISTTSTREAPSESEGRLAQREEARRMFRREVELWFGLSHPNVVRLFGACHIGNPFFVCEFATQGTLVVFLKAHPDQVWRKLHEAALGVQYLHERGITHGDLKGNNIVVGEDGLAKVTDFGLSSGLSSDERVTISGAAHWVAPECLGDDHEVATPQSDVYSLGMCVVEAMRVVEASESGQHKPPLPWEDLDNATVRVQVKKRHNLPRRPYKCTDEQWELVTRMCKYAPSERIGIMAVVDKLGKFASNQCVERGDVVDESRTLEEAVSVVVEMIQLTTAHFNLDDTYITSTYRLFWTRIERALPPLSDRVDVLWTDPEFLAIIDDATDSTKRALAKHCAALVPFIEFSLRGHSLHRRLDKLIYSKRLSPQADVMIDAGWKERIGS